MTILKNKKIRVTIAWGLVLIWMFVIFSMSAQVRGKSNGLSKGISQTIVESVEKVLPNLVIDVDKFNHIIRKSAHFCSYLLLGFLLMRALNLSGLVGTELYMLTFLICVLYAISDETHQYFVPGRGPQVRDVFIDSVGAVFGITNYAVWGKIKDKIIILQS